MNIHAQWAYSALGVNHNLRNVGLSNQRGCQVRLPGNDGVGCSIKKQCSLL